MDTTFTIGASDKMANLIFDIIRPQSLDVKLKIQRLLSKEIDKQMTTSRSSGEEVKPYSLDELMGILENDSGLSYDELRERYLNEKYQL